MEAEFTPKEREAYDRYIAKAKEVWENENQSVGIYVEQLAKVYPNKTALFFEDKSWTWKKFNEEANIIANFFFKTRTETRKYDCSNDGEFS